MNTSSRRSSLRTAGVMGLGLALLVLWGVPTGLRAQSLLNRGALVRVAGSSTTITVSGNYVSTTASTQGGTLKLDGTLRLRGNWTNNGSSSGFVAGSHAGAVVLRGGTAQQIGGSTSTIFPSLTLDNSAGASLAANAEVQSTFTLGTGLFTLGSSHLTLGASATVGGTPSATAMVVATGTGTLTKRIATTTPFTFPVGDATGTTEYSPVTITPVVASDSLSVRLVNARHPANLAVSGSPWLERYWILGGGGPTYDAAFTYPVADVRGEEAMMRGARFTGSVWTDARPASATTHQLLFTGLTEVGEFTGLPEPLASASLVVTPKVALQGPWNGTAMNADLVNTDSTLVLLPLVQPYSDPLVWNYPGPENVAGKSFYSAHPDLVDWVLVELRTGSPASPPMTVVERRAGFVKTDGSIVDVDGVNPLAFSSAASGQYHVVVRHRNHLAVMSATPLSLGLFETTYDFRTGQDKAYSANTPSDAMRSLSGGVFGLQAGDAAPDGFIDINDFTDADNNQFNAGYLLYDTNLDGFIDINDFTDADNGQFLGTQVP